MTIDAHSHVPIYEQIVAYIRSSIAAGVYRPGDTLPSIRSLALELVVNPNTVQRAYHELEREGLTAAQRGVGITVAQRGSSSAQQQSATAVKTSFAEGVRIGRQARLSTRELRTAFTDVLHDTYGSRT